MHTCNCPPFRTGVMQEFTPSPTATSCRNWIGEPGKTALKPLTSARPHHLDTLYETVS
jgi:hypothetical protein